MRKPIYVLLLTITFAFAGYGNAQERNTTSPQSAPDNTRENKQASPTVDQQKENAADREITQKIRKSVMDDKSLSSYAHNVKIITQDGKVTLQGPVNTAEEKQAIEQKASSIAGTDHVDNQIKVVPAKQYSK